jgi:hypothetical protein
MSETVYTEIRAALSQHLKNMPGVYSIAWENAPFSTTIGQPYLIPTVLWTEGSQAELGANGRNWERGIYQITCIYPSGTGTGESTKFAGLVQQRFKRGTVLNFGSISLTVRKVYLGRTTNDNSSSAGSAVSGTTGYSMPISIAFYSQVEN